MKEEQSPKDKVLVEQAVEITNLKITIQQLKEELLVEKQHRLTAQSKLNKVIQERGGNDED